MEHASAQETEVKLRVPDAESAARLLLHSGFQVRTPRHFEANWVLDTDPASLRPRDLLLRLRRVGDVSVLTYKGPAHLSQHKVREELEVTVSDFDTATLLFSRLGFDPTFRYEKFRTEYASPAEGGVATLDETPIGVFLELEGTATWIDTAAAQLGFAPDSYVLDSYGRLYLLHCERKGILPAHMVFAPPISG